MITAGYSAGNRFAFTTNLVVIKTSFQEKQMDRILALQRLSYDLSLPGFELAHFEETFLMSTVSGICTTACSNALTPASRT